MKLDKTAVCAPRPPSPHWLLLGKTAELRCASSRKPLKLPVNDGKLVLWQDAAAEMHAMDDVCPHRGASLSTGRVDRDCIRCPYHNHAVNGSRRDGGAYELLHEAGNTWVTTTPASPGSPPPPPPGSDAYPEFSLPGYRTVAYHKDLVGVNPVLLMENTLDWSHLAYVHRVHFVEGTPTVTIHRRGTSGLAEYAYSSGAFDLRIENEYHAPFTSSLRFLFRDKKTGEDLPALLLWFSFTPTGGDRVRLHLRIARGVLTGVPLLTDALFKLADELPLLEDVTLVRDVDATRWSSNALTPADEFVASYRNIMVPLFPGIIDRFVS
jgi:phenylpropionate dioxygenase-like ring-hydroxylating dioxygenase large terminal subunit